MYGSRGTTFLRRCLATSTSSSTNILQPANGGIRQRSTFAPGDFFSQLQVFFHSVSKYGFYTSRLLFGRIKLLFLFPSMLLIYLVITVFTFLSYVKSTYV